MTWEDGRRWRCVYNLVPAHRAKDGGEARDRRKKEQEGEEEEGGRERR